MKIIFRFLQLLEFEKYVFPHRGLEHKPLFVFAVVHKK